MSYDSEVLADSPVRYFPCQETAGTTLTDSSGNSGNGSIVNGAVLNDNALTASPVGTGKHIRLDGSNDYLDLGSSNWFAPATSGFSWEGWFYHQSVQSYARYFDFNTTTGTLDMLLARNNLDTLHRFDAGGSFASFTCASQLGGWHHLVITCTSGGSAKFYVDGTLINTISVGSLTNTNRVNKWVGRSTSSGADPYFQGGVTRLAVYHSVLSGARVSAHYTAGTTTPAPPNTPTGLSTDPDVTSIELTWSAATGSPTGYDVRIDAGTPVDVGNVLSYEFTGLDPSTSYTLEVRAYNSNGDSSWASIGEDTDDLPAPTGLTILGDDEDTLTLGWDSHPYAEGFEVRIDGGTPEDVGLTTIHMFDGLDELTMYELEVRAYLGSFFSDWSSIDGDTEGPPPPAGEYIVHLVVGEHEWFIAWDDVLDPDDPVQVLDGLKIGWDLNESDPWPTQPSPVTCEVGFYSTNVVELDADLAIGTPMYAVVEDGDGNEFATFHGRLTEAQAKPIKRRAGLRMLYTIKGDDYTVDLDEEPVVLVDPWPAESADDRFARIVYVAAAVGITLTPPADTGTAAFEELGAGNVTVGDLVRTHLQQIVIDGPPRRYVVVPVVDGDGLLDHFACELLENEVDAGILPGTFAIVDGLFTLVFADPEADGVVDAGDVDLDTSWTRLKYRAFNRVTVTGSTASAYASRPGPPARLDLSTTLTDQPTVDLMAELYLPDTDEALGWVADRFLFYAHRHQEGLLPVWFPDHREDPPELLPYVMPLVILRIPGNINLAGTTALAGQLSKADLKIEERKIEVGFALRRQLPLTTGGDGASWDWALAEFPTTTWDDIDPDLSWYEARLGRAF